METPCHLAVGATILEGQPLFQLMTIADFSTLLEKPLPPLNLKRPTTAAKRLVILITLVEGGLNERGKASAASKVLKYWVVANGRVQAERNGLCCPEESLGFEEILWEIQKKQERKYSEPVSTYLLRLTFLEYRSYAASIQSEKPENVLAEILRQKHLTARADLVIADRPSRVFAT